VAHASPQEIDQVGLTAALRLAACRAIDGLGIVAAEFLLDGSHDYLGDRPVTTRIKADRDCSAVAAASILAKVERDRLMRELGGSDDIYRWGSNKGYSAPEHFQALREHGPCLLHRLSWRLPGVDFDQLDLIDPERVRTARRFAEGEQLVLLDAQSEAVHV